MTDFGPDHLTEEQLRAYRDREIPEDERARLAEHIDHCADCQAWLDRNSAGAALVGVLARYAPPVPRLPDYEIERDEKTGQPLELGRGGMGVVYRARQVSLNRPVALKMILAGQLASAEDVRRFRLEAESAANLKHPHIVPIYEVGEHEGQHYFSMGLVEGQSLGKRLAARPPGTEVRRPLQRWAAGLVVTVARAVHHAHTRGILHRDLKPANILIDAQDVPYVTDFGLAKRFGTEAPDQTESGLPVGTPAYMAPEQARADKEISVAADVYGLGVILYEALAGRPPFVGRSPLEVLRQVVDAEPEAPGKRCPRLDRDLETICLKCLQKDPARRYASAEAVAEDLERWLGGEPIKARPAGRWERARKWAKRRPALAALVAVIAVAVVGSVLGWLGFTLELEAGRAEARRLAHKEGLARDRADRLARERQIEAARFARRRGQWREALALYDQALADPKCGDRDALAVERIRCLFANPSRERLVAELARLAPRTDLTGRLKAEVLLHRGDVVLWTVGAAGQDEGRALLRKALAVPNGLRPDDRAYAQGVLADGSVQAVRHFKEALAQDPFHHRANGALLMELVLTGQFEAARRQGEFMVRVFEDDVAGYLGLALVALLNEDRAELTAQRAALARVLRDPQRLAGVDQVFDFLNRVIADNRRAHGTLAEAVGRPEPKKARQDLHARAARDAVAARDGFAVLSRERLPEMSGIPLPVLTRPTDMVRTLGAAHARISWAGDHAGAAALLRHGMTKYAEALLPYLAAGAHLGLAGVHQGRRNVLACAAELRQARQLAAQAADAPTLLPFGPYRHNARWFCLILDGLYEGVRRQDGPLLVAASLGQAAPPGPPGLLTAASSLRACAPWPRDRALVARLAADAGRHDEARELLPTVLPFLPADDARTLLADWMAKAPEDLQPVRLRAELELRDGNLHAAVRYADAVLARSPNDPALRDLRARALDRLRRSAAEK